MKVTQGDQVPWQRGIEHRGGTLHNRMLMEGTPERIDNFALAMGKLGGDFFSPRHRHNFEQIRFQIAGTLDYARDGKLTPGLVGYFPEGMAYGPQTQDPNEEPVAIVLQFGGASGSGYLSRDEVKAGMDELAAFGRFEGGVYKRNDDVPGKRNTDAYQAIWEHVNGRPMVYPKPRYNHPILMDPETYAWLPVPGAPGVSERLLGVFTERRTEIALVRIEPGAHYEAHGRAVLFAVSGTGCVAGEPLRQFTTVFVDHGETARFDAESAVDVLRMGLPDLSDLMAGTPAYATAAE